MTRKRISKSMLSLVLITVLLISGVSIAQRVHNDNLMTKTATRFPIIPKVLLICSKEIRKQRNLC